jgi:hypothetical protein
MCCVVDSTDSRTTNLFVEDRVPHQSDGVIGRMITSCECGITVERVR